MCSIGNFEGWKYAQANNIGSVTRELILFSRFTGNNKFMMMLLLICCAYSGKPVTRMWAALVNSVGCILFFVTMLPTLDDIKDQGGCDPKMPFTMSVMIGGLTVVWLSAAKAEYDDMKDEMKAEQVDKQKKVMGVVPSKCCWLCSLFRVDALHEAHGCDAGWLTCSVAVQ